MKNIRRRSPSLLFNLPVLTILLILILSASYILATTGFSGIFSAEIFRSGRGLLLLVISPLVLLTFLSFMLYRMVSENLQSRRGARLRMRFFVAFCVLVLCASLPQTLIVSRFVGAALGTWFDNSISQSLKAAGDMADLYTAERLRSINIIANRYFSGLSISNYRSRATDWMPAIREIDPNAVAAQVFLKRSEFGGGPDFTPVLEIGDSSQFLSVADFAAVPEGLFFRTPQEDVYRFGRVVRYGNSTYICVYSSLLPAGFHERLNSITSGYNQSLVVDRLKPFLPTLGIWLYAVFSLPVLMMVVILALYMSSRIAEPITALEEAASRIAGGDMNVRIIAHTKDELGDLALALNTIAEQVQPRTARDKKV